MRAGRRRRDERGAVALVVALVLPLVLLGAAAFAVDISSWQMEKQRLQTAADAAALAGVPYMPYDLPAAETRARAVAARNGFTHGLGAVTVTVTAGVKSGQLVVVVRTSTENSFGSLLGAPTTQLSARAVAEYQAPAPMGSPCNTFGNEPTAGDGAASARPVGSARGRSPFPNCTEQPQLWATIEGPQTGKVQGDRYQTTGCENSGVAGCAGLTNSEYDPFGYAFVVRVQPQAVGHALELQLFDPAFVNTGQTCNLLPSASSFADDTNATNPWVTNRDARKRYTRDGTDFRTFCSGDSVPGAVPSGTLSPMTTTFVMREQVDSQYPGRAPVQLGTDGQPCITQYGGYTTTRSDGAFRTVSADLLKASTATPSPYNASVAQTLHNWHSFCRFTPTRAGSYYLQVRSNVALGGTGTGSIRRGNAAAAAPAGDTRTGVGSNSFAMRAVTGTDLEQYVAISGLDHMPIYVNSPSATTTFNLLRVLPGSAGRRIGFEFFDAADISGTSGGTVQVLMPPDATYTGSAFPSGGCQSEGGASGPKRVSVSSCTAPVSKSANNGKVQRMTIPIPSDYGCKVSSLGGCWYQVRISFPGATVTDVTTWNAQVEGDPVRLVE